MRKAIKKLFTLVLALTVIVSAAFSLTACAPSKIYGYTVVKDKALLREAQGSWNYLWEMAVNGNGWQGYGLVPDKSNTYNFTSIASTGYALAAIPFAVENDWITHEQGEERAEGTLDTMIAISQKGTYNCLDGFFAHFIDGQTASNSNSEISTIDTALLIAGALVSGEYFGGSVREKATDLYAAVNWKAFVKSNNRFYMSASASTGVKSGEWSDYSEALIMYFLGAGAPNPEYRTDKKVYDSFRRTWVNDDYGNRYITSYFNTLFTYQFSHSYIDFRNLTDADGINWFDNSVAATKSHIAIAKDNPDNFKTLSAKSWGYTASEGPDGYVHTNRYIPAGVETISTVAPSAAIASIVFTPKESYRALKHYQKIDDLDSDYGLKDAYDLDRNWTCAFSVGINKGNTLLMIANMHDGFIWELFMQNEYIQNAIDVMQFVRA